MAGRLIARSPSRMRRTTIFASRLQSTLAPSGSLLFVCCLLFRCPYTLCTFIKNFSSVKDSTGWDHLLHKKSRDPRRHPTGLFKLFPGKFDHNDDFVILMTVTMIMDQACLFPSNLIKLVLESSLKAFHIKLVSKFSFFCSTTKRTQMNTSVR